jgi:hypothetical protein
LDGVAVVEHVLRSTAELLEAVPKVFRDRLWLFRSATGKVEALDARSLNDGIRALVQRHGLLGDDGKPLVASPSRLRKTFEHRLWRLSDGDLLAVAAAMNQSPRVADRNYLSLDDQTLAEAAVFIHDDLAGVLRSPDSQAAAPKSIENTPAGRCVDTLSGHRAPKDGTNHCDQFVNCFGCPSFAIVGTVPDLHRLFSYQAFLHAEIAHFTSSEWDGWRDNKRRLIMFIDHFVEKNFRPKLVEEARQLAKESPHRFWAIRMERNRATRNSVGGAPNV